MVRHARPAPLRRDDGHYAPVVGINHVAIAVRDMAATHEFYTEAMGFELRKTVVVPREGGGFARHVFYSTGSDEDQLIAFWDLANDPTAPAEFETDISRGLGLDPLINHLAFQATDVDDLVAKRQHWIDRGHTVLEIDHGWVHSIYTEDPDGIYVEFAVVTSGFTDADRVRAAELLVADDPVPDDDEPVVTLHSPGADPVLLSGATA